VNPNHLQVLAVRTAALAQSGRSDEAAKAAEILLKNFPDFTVERHLRNFHWKLAEDTAHYRDGLLKGGVPAGGLSGGPVPDVDPASSNVLALRPVAGTG
jgi:adenylate cyclase